MADREFVFSQPEVQRVIREKFIPLAMDDWYLRRQSDANGKFFLKMYQPCCLKYAKVFHAHE